MVWYIDKWPTRRTFMELFLRCTGFFVLSEAIQLEASSRILFKKVGLIDSFFSGLVSLLLGPLGRLLKLNLPSGGQYTMVELR